MKRFLSGKATEMQCAYSFPLIASLHSIAKPAAELWLLGIEIEKRFLMLPAQIGNLSSPSKYFSFSAFIVESCLTCLGYNTPFEVQETETETGR